MQLVMGRVITAQHTHSSQSHSRIRDCGQQSSLASSPWWLQYPEWLQHFQNLGPGCSHNSMSMFLAGKEVPGALAPWKQDRACGMAFLVSFGAGVNPEFEA